MYSKKIVGDLHQAGQHGLSIDKNHESTINYGTTYYTWMKRGRVEFLGVF
jgi:hypothetical protein